MKMSYSTYVLKNDLFIEIIHKAVKHYKTTIHYSIQSLALALVLSTQTIAYDALACNYPTH